eukprot:TRINITY_DN23993_c0_g1_i1.p2 TRINITY_DN23993_c0_g1~~TRINITY_DN23993_c0_g1_i1.p2  ORF type:complete len:167 (-),score=60.37 TRINITY_DN23993_c0_g1_i1:21-494(-)
MKTTIFVIAMLMAVSMINASESTDLFEGFISGYGSSGVNMQECKEEVGDVMGDISSAFRDFQVRDKTYLKRGLSELGSAFNSFVHALDSCGATEVAEKLGEVAAKMYSGYGEIEETIKLVVDGVDIYDDITSAANDYESGDYYGTGEELGRLTSTLL